MPERRILNTLTRPLTNGMLALLPVGLTLAIIGWLVSFLARMLGPKSALGEILKQVGWNIGGTEFGAWIGGVLFSLLLIYLLGLLVEIVLKDRWGRWLDRLTSHIPVISTVYEAAKKIVQMLEPRQSADMQSMTPVMCNFGNTSFPAFMPTSETFVLNGAEYQVIMIPTAPVPFGGAIMCVPKTAITPLNCGIDGLFNIYMSMGTTVPDYMPTPSPTPSPTPHTPG